MLRSSEQECELLFATLLFSAFNTALSWSFPWMWSLSSRAKYIPGFPSPVFRTLLTFSSAYKSNTRVVPSKLFTKPFWPHFLFILCIGDISASMPVHSGFFCTILHTKNTLPKPRPPCYAALLFLLNDTRPQGNNNKNSQIVPQSCPLAIQPLRG